MAGRERGSLQTGSFDHPGRYGSAPETGKSLLHVELLRVALPNTGHHESFDLEVLFRGRALLVALQNDGHGAGNPMLIRRIDRECMDQYEPGWPEQDSADVEDYLRRMFPAIKD